MQWVQGRLWSCAECIEYLRTYPLASSVYIDSTPAHLDEWKKEKPEPDNGRGYVAMQGIRCLGK
jgi:hypothetical protein